MGQAQERLDAATMLQPEPDASGQSRKTTVQETAKTACICDFFRQGRTHLERFDLTYKEGVAGSNPASPTTFFLQIAVFCGHGERAGKRFPALFLQPCWQEGALLCRS